MHCNINKVFIKLWILLLPICLAGCAQTPAPKLEPPPLIIIQNEKSVNSKKITEAYLKARNLPNECVALISCVVNEEIALKDYTDSIETPVKRFIEKNNLKNKITYIVLTKGVPIRIKEGGYSVDSFLMNMYNPLKPMPQNLTPEDVKRCLNPYFGAKERFSFSKYGFYLATRLDGYNASDAINLINNAQKAKPEKGLFLLDLDPAKTDKGLVEFNQSMKRAAQWLGKNGYEVKLDEGADFVGDAVGLMGYYSWGSNDKRFVKHRYQSLRFKPGAIAETCVSTSAHTFYRANHWQSLIADLIYQGITGVKGYVSEPYSVALCPADLLFERYTSGYTLGESFWMATPFLKWKDVVIGDPLCQPYSENLAIKQKDNADRK